MASADDTRFNGVATVPNNRTETVKNAIRVILFVINNFKNKNYLIESENCEVREVFRKLFIHLTNNYKHQQITLFNFLFHGKKTQNKSKRIESI